MRLGRAPGFTALERMLVLALIVFLAAVLFPKYRRQVELARMSNMIWAVYTVSAQADLYILRNGSAPDFSGLSLGAIRPDTPDWKYSIKGSPPAGKYVVEAERNASGGKYSLCAKKSSPDAALCWTCVRGEGRPPISDMADTSIVAGSYCGADPTCVSSCSP